MLLFLWILLVPGGLALSLSFSTPSSTTAYTTFSVTVTKSQSDTASVYLSLDPSTASSSVILYGNLAVTFSSSSSTATFSNLYITTTGTGYKLIASAIGYGSVSSSSFDITSGTSQTLYFSAQPTSASDPCSSDVIVQVLNPPIGKNTVDTSFASSITLSLIPGSGYGTMSSVSVTATNGVSTFSSCSVTGAGTFVLKASASGLSDAYSSSFTISSGTPSSITFNSYPTTIYKGSGFSVTATVTDSSGNKVVSSIKCYLQAKSGNGQISSGGSATLNLGSLSFSNVIYTGTGSVEVEALCSGYSAFATTFTATSYSNGELAINLNDAIFEGTYNQYYQIYLTDKPLYDVIVSISSKDSSSLEITTTTLTFTDSNYATAQKVYFNTGMLASTSYPVNIGVIHSISSSDSTYNGVANFQTCLTASSGSISVPIYGSTKYYIQADSSVGLQAKDSTQLYISIGAAPSSDVVVSMTLSNSYITLSSSQVTFTSSSWSTQRILITGPSSASSPYQTTTITYTVSTSDSNFNSAIFYPSDKTTTAVILPASTPTIKVSNLAILVQSKQYATFDVWLSSQPSSTVTVTISSSDTTNLSLTTSSLSFTTSDYKLFKQATIYAAAGSMGSTPYTAVTVTLSDSSGGYSSVTIVVSVANICINAPYAWPNGPKCTCPAGFNCMGSTPVPCPPGTYSAQDDMVCTACQAGQYCADPTQTAQSCASGTYSYEYYSFCLACPGGFSCPNQSGYEIQRCVQGQYSDPGSGTCSSPTSGEMAPGPEVSFTVACPSGYIIVGSPDICVPCPAGVSCSGNPVTYTSCSAGTYSLAGMASCATCPDNMECDPFQGPTRICPEGTYRASGESVCKLCPAHYYCSASEGTGSSARPKACATDYDSVEGSAYCKSTTTLAGYPGLTTSGSSVVTSTDVDDYVKSYDAWKDNIICSSGWGWCYPIPGGEDGAGNYATSNKYSYIGSDTISPAFIGFWLPDNADRPDMIGFECWPGNYCDGSSTMTKCGDGKFNAVVRAYDSTFCFDCPLGYECIAGTGNYENSPCPQGKYCEAGVSTGTNCPEGTYYKKLRAISEGYCLQCPEGYYCPEGTGNPIICPAGRICPIGSTSATACPEGTYNPLTGKYKIEDCLLCPAGTSCGSGSAQPLPCSPGKIGPYQANPLSSCWVCPAGYACPGAGMVEAIMKCEIGYYCPEGSTRKTQNPCPPGTVGTMYGAYGLAQCDQCPPGFACGYATNYVNNPPVVCAAGYYCPIGTHFTKEFPCPAGTYSENTRVEGVHECLICPAGYYCPAGTSSYSSNTCPAGYYCPRGTTYDKQYICPVGTYNAGAASDQGECTFCTAGNFCPGYISSSSPPIPCPAGTYMEELGAQDGGPGVYPSCKRCPAGKYSSASGLSSCTDADKGSYTYEGASGQITCKAGFFCAEVATSELMMYLSVCPAGFKCTSGMNSYPTLGSNGCPAGQYCPEGSSSGTNCPAGTYRNTKGAKSVKDCKTVPAGYYVSSAGTSDYSGYLCSAGYYCPKGSTTSTAMACPAGTFREETGGASVSDCASCTPGYYCPTTATTTPTICTIGSYCPSGTITPLQCPSGTYGANTGLATSTDCTSCDAGHYCQSPGQTGTTDTCTEGFYCSGGASIATPNDGQTGKKCPAGGYCPAGTTSPQKCSAGTFNNFDGGRSSSDCVTCWPGYYCAGTDLSPSPTGKCDPGYYCPAGESTSNSHAAQAGYYAPSGSVAQIACAAGTYNPSTAASSCISCDPGNYCPTTTLTSVTPCEEGKYCLQGSFIGKFCPPGTYRLATGGQSIDDCTLCNANKYCLYSGQTAVAGSCSAGYYCTSSSPYPQPYADVPGYYGPCPVGYYCLGSSDQTACLAGTFNPSTTGSDSSHCLPCPAGYACTTTALSTYMGTQCRQGWYCTESSTTREPGSGICPEGSYCPQGSAVDLLCAAGTYQDLTNQASCQTCPPGYYCPPGTSDYTANVCPAGYYCESGTSYPKQFPCPVGTYNPNSGQQSSAACIDCTPGYYCNQLGASAVAGQCDPGFYCISKSTTSRPQESQTYGGRCNPGYYCPQGSTSSIPCDSGKYCSADELSAVSGSCQAGYYCNSKATTPAPTDGTTGNICSPMYYCTGSASPVQCSAGNYLPYSGASANTECITCSPGYFCDGSTSSSNMRQACTAGFYCPGGDITPTYECDRGYYCPGGTADEILCPAGKYQMNTKQSSCVTCDPGYYCDLGASSETLCPTGYYCPSGTGYYHSYPCPVGTYNSLIGQSDSTACVSCDPGKYCPTLGAALYQSVCAEGYYCIGGAFTDKPSGSDSTGGMCSPGYYCPEGSSAATKCEAGLYCAGYALPAQSGSCLAGYYCLAGSTVANPTDGTQGNICSQGNYCPTESSAVTPCSAGTYSPSEGLSDYTQCLDCPYGKYCNSQGLSSPTGDCTAGYYCDPGKATPTPPEGECPTGYYCEAGSWVPIPCAMGYYNTQTQQSSCTQCGSGYYCTGSTAIQTNCPTGYHCPVGTRYSNEYPCGPGTYADVTNLETCNTCPAGRECNNAATNANSLCPQYKYCPEGTGYGLICPSGSYNKDSEGLTADTECSVCPSGQYCVDGRISGQCAPGFWCKKSSPYSTPSVYYLTGTPCPSGYYCGLGTTTPTKCPEGKFRKDTGATQVSDCTTCPPGSYCVTGNPTPFDCPKGNYCPSGVNSPTPCPKYTYNGSKSMSDINACKPCPAGYYCDDTGIGDYTQYPCKKGYFCVLGATSYIPCPPGTVGSSSVAGSASDCPACPGGYYCEEATTSPVACTIGTYCPLGSSAPIPCTPGYICNDLTETPTKCPVHYYCPLYDSTNLTKYYTEDEAIECPTGTICQLANFYPETCEPGTYMADNVCIECGAGLYANGTSSEKCYPCDAGYLCVAGATRSNPQTLSNDGGYPCPSGYYCPEGTESAIPCPITTYNPSTKGKSASACLACPANTYGDEEGLSKCKICGSHAYSDAGQDTCQCKGKYRGYQKYDGSCICLPTYEFVIEGVTESEVDSAEDCTPKQYTNCISGQVRKADGSCKSSGSCESECNGGSGNLDSTYSVCICDDTPSEEDVCNSTCRSTSASVTLKSDGQFYIYNPSSGSSRPVSMTGSNYLGATSVSDSSKVHTVDMTSDGPQGVYGTGSSLSTYYRRLLTDDESRFLAASSEGLSNPIACIKRNDTFLFSLTPRSHYPVYLKDSLLNTNKNFDYAAFKELEWRMKSSSSYVDTFAFTFTDAGIYDFVDNADSDKHIIIAVVGDSESCPSQDVTFLARTSLNLDALNIYAADNLMTEPQWGIIAGIIVALIILIILIIGFLSFLHWRAWASVNSKERLYAMLRSCCKKCRFKSNLVPVVPAFEESIEDGIDFDKELLEPSQFKDMYDNLCKYYDRVKAAFDAQDEEATIGLNELLEQARELKDQLADKLADIDPEILKQKIVEAEFDEDEEIVLPEAIIDEEIPTTYNDAVAEILRKETLIEVKNTEILSKDIQNNPDLMEHDKQELIGELNANMQRLDQLLNADIQNSQSELNKRLQERAAKRRAAQREKAYYEPKKAEIIARQKEEREAIEKELKDEVENINEDYLNEKENYKKETRKEVEQRLLEIRTQLQNDLANSKNQQETDALMKNFEIEAKRIEDQLTAHKKQQEADLFKRLEERRKGRLGKVNANHEEKKKDMEERHQEELAQLERNTLLAFAEGNGEILLNEDEKREIEDVGEEYDQELVRLQEAHQQELLQIDNILDQEEAAQSEEKERLIKALENASSQTEKDQILKEIDRLDEAIGIQKGKQETDLKQRLLDRKRRKAEKEAQIKVKQDRERFDVEMQQKEAERDARSNIEMRKMEEILENAGNISAEELIGLARQLLEAKHDREIGELTALKHGKLRERQNTLIQAAVNIKAVERASLRAQYLAQREALKKRKLKPEELQAKIEELEAREKEAQNQLEFNNMAQLNSEQDQAWRDVEDEFREKFNNLADTHMKENAEIFKKISESDPRMANANLSDMEKDIDKLRSENERLYAEKLRELDLRNQQLREFERRKELEISSIQEQLKEVEEKQRRLEEIQEQRRIMEERQRMMVEVMKERGISPEKMEELLKQHQKEMDEWEKSMEDERTRQKSRLQAKLDERKQKYQEKISSQIQKYKEENLKLIEQQDKEEQERLKIISYSGVELKLWEPKEDVESNLRIGVEMGKDGEKSDMSLLDQILQRVRRVEKIAENVDTSQFDQLMKAMKHVNDMVDKVKKKIR
ncbi:unnamed protein product [Blepharisma stoltei]|uniref:Uncharacterized protein n=1 Tax=Blepharisma stoltei TaxID=1481888 RepID=A0AAU9IR64_9CILI|nr:unnamed protein product [Blepharisma stoltei]